MHITLNNIHFHLKNALTKNQIFSENFNTKSQFLIFAYQLRSFWKTQTIHTAQPNNCCFVYFVLKPPNF